MSHVGHTDTHFSTSSGVEVGWSIPDFFGGGASQGCQMHLKVDFSYKIEWEK